METVLIIDDDEEIHSQLKIALGGYELLRADSIGAARDLLCVHSVSLIILDVSLPDGNGLKYFMELREGLNGVPIIFLTSRDQSVDKVAGLSLGADDYVTKPFDFLEMKARVALRIAAAKKNEDSAQVKKIGLLRFDLRKMQVLLMGGASPKPIPLTAFEFKLLLHFAENEGRVLSRRQLLDSLWGDSLNVVDRSVDVHVSKLRRKIKKSSCTIRSVYGEGYQFTELRENHREQGSR